MRYLQVILLIALFGAHGLSCSSKESESSASLCGNGSAFERDGETYCYYSSELIIEGFECPLDVPNLYNGPGGVAFCAPIPDLPGEVVDDIFRDWEVDENNPMTLERTQEELCSDPSALATGQNLRLTGARVQKASLTCTSAACGPIGVDDAGNPSDMGSFPPQCCNFCEGGLEIDCGGSSISLVAAPGASFDPVQGVNVDLEPGDPIISLVESETSEFGCIGQQCHEVCTVEPDTEVRLTGMLKNVSGELVFELSDFEYP